MTDNVPDTVVNTEAINTDVNNKIITCIEGDDWIQDYSVFGLNFDNNEQEILEAIGPAIEEKFHVSIKDGDNYLYKVRKAVDSQNIYIIPNSTAGQFYSGAVPPNNAYKQIAHLVERDSHKINVVSSILTLLPYALLT